VAYIAIINVEQRTEFTCPENTPCSINVLLFSPDGMCKWALKEVLALRAKESENPINQNCFVASTKDGIVEKLSVNLLNEIKNGIDSRKNDNNPETSGKLAITKPYPVNVNNQGTSGQVVIAISNP
jgi:hypothetical protein